MHDSSRSLNNSRPLAVLLALLFASYCVLYRFVPYQVQLFLPWPLLALAVFAGARLKLTSAILLVLAVQGATDLAFYLFKDWSAVIWVYLAMALNIGLGRGILKKTNSLGLSLGTGAIGYIAFFVLTNFGSWVETALPEYSPHSFQTLLLSFEKGLEYLRERPFQAFGHLFCCGAAFQLHAYLARVYFPAESLEIQGVR